MNYGSDVAYCGFDGGTGVTRRISLAVPIASSVLETTCAARARCMSSVAFDFEQLGVREDDPELVVQAVEEEPQFG